MMEARTHSNALGHALNRPAQCLQSSEARQAGAQGNGRSQRPAWSPKGVPSNSPRPSDAAESA